MTVTTPDPGSFAYRARGIVRDVLRDAARRNERSLAWVRIVFSTMFVVRELLLSRLAFLHGSPKESLIVGLMLVAIGLSALYLVQDDAQRVARWSRGFAAYEVATLLLVNFAVLWWPEADYEGLLKRPYIALLGLACCAAGMRLRRGLAIATGTAVVVGLLALMALDVVVWGPRATWSLIEGGYWVLLTASSAIFGVVLAVRTLAFVNQTAERAIDAERARERLGAYLGHAVAEQALQVDEIVLGGVRQRVAVLFSDLRGFTAYAERLAPEEMVAQLNAYLEQMVAQIERHGGVVDKYMGDGIMAVFGAPRTGPRDVDNALHAAVDMLRALDAHNVQRKAQGLPPLRMGIGVHAGEAIAGNVGTPSHAQYTIIGDVVNVASRLESATKEHDVAVLVSDDVRTATIAAGIPLRPLGEMPLRGRIAPIGVWTLG